MPAIKFTVIYMLFEMTDYGYEFDWQCEYEV